MFETRGILIALLMCLLIVHFVKMLQSRKMYPLGPLQLPVIGGLWKIGFALSQDTFIKLAEQYGNIYTLWMGSKPMVVLSGFQAVKEGLINQSESFSERPATPFIRVVTRGKGQPLDTLLPIRNSVCNVICAAAFGSCFSIDDKEFLKLTESVSTGINFTSNICCGIYELFPWVMDHLPGPHKKAFSCLEYLVSFSKKEIEKHKEYQSVHNPRDFIDFYLLQIEKCKEDPNSTYNEENLAHSIFDLFIAGTNTTIITLQWALLFMATHPDIQEKVHKEMEEVLGSSQSLSYQDWKHLPYTNAVVHETQRAKFALLFGLPRQCAKDVNMFGSFIPKGTYVIPDLRSVLLDPKKWETPREFNPNHFLDKDGNFVAREEFLPFGAGARVCPGEKMAKAELFIFFASLLRAFTFQLPQGVKELNKEPAVGILVYPPPHKLCAVPRYRAS